jgi:hypothetical protein
MRLGLALAATVYMILLSSSALGGDPMDVRSCFNSTGDSTLCLQRGFDASASTGQPLVVPAMPTPWRVTPLYLRRNNTRVVLAPGAVIEAMRGPAFFTGYSDCLLRFTHFVGDAAPPMGAWDKHAQYPTLPLRNISLLGGAGSVLRMWKTDYMNRSHYNFTEHRHAISMTVHTVACCLLPAACCPLPAACCLVCCLVCCMPLTDCCLLLTACCLLHAACCLLPCLLPCLLHAAYCLLHAACCP